MKIKIGIAEVLTVLALGMAAVHFSLPSGDKLSPAIEREKQEGLAKDQREYSILFFEEENQVFREERMILEGHWNRQESIKKIGQAVLEKSAKEKKANLMNVYPDGKLWYLLTSRKLSKQEEEALQKSLGPILEGQEFEVLVYEK